MAIKLHRGDLPAEVSFGPVVAISAGLWRADSRLFFGADSYYLVRVETLRMDGSGREAFEQPELPINVVHREGRHATQKVRAFVDLAIDRLRADPSLNQPTSSHSETARAANGKDGLKAPR